MEVAQKFDVDTYGYDSEFDSSAHTSSSGCDASMENGFDISNEDFSASSPIPKLTLTSHCDDSSPEDGNGNVLDRHPSLGSHSISPPYKRVRALRLFDSPATPKTLFEKCSLFHTPATPSPRFRLFSRIENPKSIATTYPKLDKPTANVNPFTPNGMLLMSKKRSRSKRSLVG